MTAALLVVVACTAALLVVLAGGRTRKHRQVRVLESTDSDLTAALVGTAPDGSALVIDLADGEGRTLLAFLTSTCVTCRGLWAELAADLTAGVSPRTDVVIITGDAAAERAAVVRELAPPTVRVLMSTATWRRYGISTAPAFVLVGGVTGRVLAHGTAVDRAGVLRLVRTGAGTDTDTGA